jgi:hypothetical protein
LASCSHRVTATATTNFARVDAMNDEVLGKSGNGKTTATYTWNQPYSSGTSSQPITGSQEATDSFLDSYN